MQDVTVRFSFTSEGHEALFDADTQFYFSLPNVDMEYRDPRSGYPSQPTPDLKKTLMSIGTAVLSSTLLATTITGYVQNHRVRIELKDGRTGNSVTYEGPDSKLAPETVERAISELICGSTDEGKRDPLSITASRR